MATTTTPIHFEFACQKNLDYIYDSLKSSFEIQDLSNRSHHTRDSLKVDLFDQKLAEVLMAVKDDGVPIGLVLFSITNRNFNYFAAPGLFIHSIYVENSYQQQKVGTHLLNEVVTIAKARGCRRVDFAVLKSNDVAINFVDSISHIKEVDYAKYFRITV